MTIRIRQVRGTGTGKSSSTKGSTDKRELLASGPLGTTRFAVEAAVWGGGWVLPTTDVIDPLNGGTRTLIYRDIDIQPLGGNHWKIIINYVDPERADEERPEEGTYKFRASGGVKMVRMKQALEHIASYAPPGKVASDHKGAILVADGEVEGTEAPVASGKISYTYSHPEGVVDEEFARELELLIGQVNEEEWHGYEAGELCLEDFDASDSSDGPAEVTLVFEVIPNITGATYGEIVGVDHEGHDFIWFEYDKKVDTAAKRLIAPPIAAHVEQVKYRINFEDAFGF